MRVPLLPILLCVAWVGVIPAPHPHPIAEDEGAPAAAPPFPIAAVLESDCEPTQRRQAASIRRFAPWVVDVLPAPRPVSPLPDHFLFVAPCIIFTAPVFWDDFFTTEGLPILKASVMTAKAHQSVLAQIRHPKYKRRPIAGRIEHDAALGLWVSDAPSVPSNRSWLLPRYVHRDVLPATAALFGSSFGDLNATTAVLAVDALMHDGTPRFRRSLLRTIHCTFAHGRGDEHFRSPWLGDCVPVVGPFLDRYFRVVAPFLCVALDPANASHADGMEALMQRILLPDTPRSITAAPSLMVVAHADDEALFGGDSLLLYGPWHLLCATCAEVQDARYAPSPYYYNHWRPAEFRRLARLVGATVRLCNHSSWGLKGDLPPRGNLKGFREEVLRELRSRRWHRIVTHDGPGPTDHIQHVEVWEAVRAAWLEAGQPAPLYTFAHRPHVDDALAMAHLRLLGAYPSQASVVEKHFALWHRRGGLQPAP